MPRYKIAHIHEQGVDLIIIPLDASFGAMTISEQHEEMDEFQFRARSAGLAGTVVPVWREKGRMMFIAPTNWHLFLSSLSPEFVQMNLNRELFWQPTSLLAHADSST